MKPIVLLFIFILFETSVFAQNESAKKELEKLSIQWMDAWKEKDTVALNRILAPDFRLVAVINNEFVTIHRDKWLQMVPVYIPEKVQYHDFDIRVYDKSAVVQSRVEQEASLYGQDRSGTFQVTDVWIKKGDTWQVVHRHTSLKVRTSK